LLQHWYGRFLGNHIVPYTILALFTGGRDYARASAECFVEVVFESVKSTTDWDGWTCMAELRGSCIGCCGRSRAEGGDNV